MSIITPTSLVGARSPIYVTANYSALAGSLTDITLEIFIWDGARTSKPSSPQYTLFRDVFAGTDVSFDIAPLVREYLQGTYSSTAITAPAIAEDGTIVWLEVDYEVNYVNKAQPPQTVNDTGSSDIFSASNGYHTFAEGANFETPSIYLNQVDKVYIKESGNEVLPIYIGAYGSEDVEEIYYSDGLGDYAIDLTSFHDPTQPEGSIVRLPIGTTNLTTYLDSLGYAGITPDNLDSYTLALYNSQSIIDFITVEKVCEPKYTINTIEFINRYGAWEHLHFFKASQDNVEVTSEQYRKSIGTSSSSGFTYDTTEGVYQRFNTNGKTRTTLNTGFIEEDYKETIKDLMMSERVMLNGSPVNVVTNSMTLQKRVNDKTINYTIEVEEAFDTRYV
jgi:hypothetical protein